MSDYEYQKARIERLKDKWASILGMRWWTMTYDYYDDTGNFARATDTDRDAATFGVCKADWRYMHARISYCVPVAESLDDEELEVAVIHEFMHVLVHETRTFAGDGWHIGHEERVCSALARSFLWAWQDGRE